VSADLLLSLGKIMGSVGLLAAVLWIVGRLARRFRLQPELGRKLIHVALGLYCLTFPLIFRESWEVAATCALAVVVFMLARRGGSGLGQGLHGVGRVSYGELLFAVSVALLFHLKDGHWLLELEGLQTRPQLVLYVLPLTILTLCDAACALVGVNYGRTAFPVEEGIKSWEGVAVFFVTAWLVSLIVLLLFSELPRGEVVVLALITALFGALFEGASWRGLDNLFIPLGLYFILANLVPRGLTELLVATLAFVAVTGALLLIGRRAGVTRHVTASGATLLFCIAIFSGAESVLTPAAAFAAYFLVWRRGARAEEPYDALNLIVAVLALALGFFVLSDLTASNTIFAFNLTFAAFAAAIVARFGRDVGPALLAGACLAAWAVAAVRILLVAGWREDTALFGAVTLASILLVAGAAAVLARRSPARPWIKIGLLSFLAGAAALPLSPA
jgi:phytol kinase